MLGTLADIASEIDMLRCHCLLAMLELVGWRYYCYLELLETRRPAMRRPSVRNLAAAALVAGLELYVHEEVASQ